MTLSLEKSSFFREEVSFLGIIIIPREEIRPDPKKPKTIESFPAPLDRKQLQSFLGVCEFHRRFTEQYANYIDPFRDILQANTEWE